MQSFLCSNGLESHENPSTTRPGARLEHLPTRQHSHAAPKTSSSIPTSRIPYFPNTDGRRPTFILFNSIRSPKKMTVSPGGSFVSNVIINNDIIYYYRRVGERVISSRIQSVAPRLLSPSLASPHMNARDFLPRAQLADGHRALVRVDVEVVVVDAL